MEGLIDSHILPASIAGFILLWIVMAKFLFKPVLGMLDARQQEIKTTYNTAEEERARAEEFRADYEKRLVGIEAEARARLQAAVKEAQDAKDQILTEARGRSEDILRRGQEDLVREREKTLAAIREEVVTISLSAAGKIIGESMDSAKHRSLVSDFIDKLGASK